MLLKKIFGGAIAQLPFPGCEPARRQAHVKY